MTQRLTRSLTVSVVSHGHGPMVERLLDQLATHCGGTVARVILTQNIDEPRPQTPQTSWPFDLVVIRPAQPQGFAANHNRAFARCMSEFFCVLNPDVSLAWGDPFKSLVRATFRSHAGLSYPMQMRDFDCAVDAERELPTPWSLFRRHVLRMTEPRRIDWVNGACMVFKSHVFRDVGGFNEGFRLYCEDVDLCLRIQCRQLQLVAVPVKILHKAQRASHRRARYLIWHLQSLFRLWRSPIFWWALKRG